MINNMKRIPVALMWTMLVAIMFFFVDYTWITDSWTRGMFCVIVLIGGGFVTAINGDTKFWVYKKP